MATSEFDSLVEAWRTILDKHLDHRDECVRVAKRLCDWIVSHCQWPEDLMATYRLDVMPYGAAEKKGLIREAMKVDDDGYCCFGLELSTPSKYSHDPKVRHSCLILHIMFFIGIKKTGTSFAVRIKRDG